MTDPEHRADIDMWACPDCETLVTTEAKAAAHCSATPQSEPDRDSNPDYITDPEFTGDEDAVREHYRRVWPVYNALSTVGNAITNGGAGDTGWYQYEEHLTDIDVLEEGWDATGRPITLTDHDRDAILGKIRGRNDPEGSNRWRVLYNITSWKDPAAMDRGLLRRFDPADNEDKWEGDERNPLPDYQDVRGMGLWVDLDLDDDLKERRGRLDEKTLDTVERAQAAFIEEIAALYGPAVDPEDIAAFDSGGGAYLYGPPAATLPIAEHFADDADARQRVFDELSDRLNDFGTTQVNERVFESVPDAEGLLDPDWMQNKNRKSKAPLAIHHKHDVVVTPLRNGEGQIDYTPTLVSETDDDLIAETAVECDRLTSPDHPDAVESLVATLWSEGHGEHGGWKATLDAWVAGERARERNQLHQRALDEKRQRERLAERRQELAERRGVDPSEIAPDEALAGMTVTTIRQDVFDAVDRIDVSEIIRDFASNDWNTSSRDHETTFDPNWRDSGSGMSCAVPYGSETFVDNSCDGGGGPAKAYALGKGILRGKDAAALSLDGAAWGEAIDGLRSEGYDIPVFVPEAGEEHDQTPLWALENAAVALDVCGPDDFIERASDDGSTYVGFPDAETYNATLEALETEGIDHGRDAVETSGYEGQGGVHNRHPIQTCEPPERDAVDVDREDRWDELQGERLGTWLDRDPGTLEIGGDPPGDGKTTNFAAGLDGRDEPHAITVPKHENCYEFTHDEAKPDGYFHHKGSGQPAQESCMAAQVEADEGETPECDIHGHPSNCPRMCPVKGLSKDDDLRVAFEAIEREVGTQRAHEILDPHDGMKCNWQHSYETLENAERVVTVHNYLTQQTVKEVGKIGLDDLQQLPIATQSYSVSRILRAANRMDSIGNSPRMPGMLTEFGSFTRDVVDLMTGAYDDDSDVDGIEDLDPPTIPSAEVPTNKEWKDRVGGHFVKAPVRGEPIAQAKLAYNETVVDRMKRDEWESGDEPLCFDAVIALAVTAGLDAEPAHQAIATPTELDTCPVCGHELATMEGKRVCTDCGLWDEEDGNLVHPDDDPARAQARVVLPTDPDGEANPEIEYRTLPMPADLPAPEDTLVLDATPKSEVMAALFGLDQDNVVVTGDEPRELNAHITQIGNGQYHRGTIDREGSYGDRLRERLQKVVDIRCGVCEQVLVVSHKSNRRHFDLPDNAEWMHFHSGRGLDRSDYDAVIVIGAPHPNVEDLRRDAELLAMHRDDMDIGGVEHSTHPDAENDPIYRQLHFTDENGQGREIPTKQFTGLVGALFRSSREHEIEQLAHRVRPGQAAPEDLKYIDLVTNVPTNLPVDEFARLEELTDPNELLVPVSEGALRLARHVRDLTDGGGPDGFRPDDLIEHRSHPDGSVEVSNKVKGYHRLASLCGEDVCEETVRNWIRELEGIGLLQPETYECRRGVSYTADPPTLERALQVLSYNAGFKVAATRALAAKIHESATGLDWLSWAEDVFDVSGDRCTWSPPGNGGGSTLHGG